MKKIEEIIDKAEAAITDLEIPAKSLAEVKKNVLLVQSQLKLGTFEADPMLKSRAENFLYNFQNFENNRNKRNAADLLKGISEHTKSLGLQMEKDTKKIISDSKKLKLGMAIGGAVLGAAGGLFMNMSRHHDADGQHGELSPEQEFHPDKTSATERFPFTADPDKVAGQPTSPEANWIPTMEHAQASQASVTHLEDVIDSSKVQGSDSIWRSTHDMIEHNPEKFGYHGDINDHVALDKFAENQTANLVAQLNKEQGGNLADLVHSGDKVVVDFKDGHPHLSFEASSGIKAGHLPDNNMEKIFADAKFNPEVEHGVHLDQQTGNQYMEIHGKDGVYKVYDWDRDSQPNVVMPDGRSLEMSPADLDKFMSEHSIISHPVETGAVAGHPEAGLDEFLSERGASYNAQLFEAAKAEGKVNDLFHSVLETRSDRNLHHFVNDYGREHNFSPDKTSVFYHQLKHHAESVNYHEQGSIDDLAKSLDDNVVKSFNDIKGGEANIWRPVQLGPEGQYALIQKYHTGSWPMRSDRYFVDTNGDERQDFAIQDSKQMQQAFKAGYFQQAVDPHPSESQIPLPDKVQPEETFVPKSTESPWAPEHKTLEGSEVKYNTPESDVAATGQKSPWEIPNKTVIDDEPKIIDTSDQIKPATEQPAVIDLETVKDVAPDTEQVKVEPVALAVESINRGDPSFHFNMDKIQSADLAYLSKLKEDIEGARGMLPFLENSEGERVRILEAGYKEILEQINKRLEKN
ncbi:MAG: hypothetical protein C3F02_01120 [Parcubacteria group bacterium]|nr:MAG: hypothetical protein C3F02_01120 [Parcubacteria group bacterium]